MSNTHVVIASTAAGCAALYGLLWTYFGRANRGARSLYFDAQDFAKYENGGGKGTPCVSRHRHFRAIPPALHRRNKGSHYFGSGIYHLWGKSEQKYYHPCREAYLGVQYSLRRPVLRIHALCVR